MGERPPPFLRRSRPGAGAVGKKGGLLCALVGQREALPGRDLQVTAWRRSRPPGHGRDLQADSSVAT